MEGAAGLLRSKVSREYLRTNSTSHVNPFGAVAELIDNAADAGASDVRIDFRPAEPAKDEARQIVVTDNGVGMDREKLHRMLSFGFCDKTGKDQIGRYGNGFKSGAMRLADTAFVFTKTNDEQSVGMLSQHYLRKIDADEVIVPIVTWRRGAEGTLAITREESAGSLAVLCEESGLWDTEAALLTEFSVLDEKRDRDEQWSHSRGTHIVLDRPRKYVDDEYELVPHGPHGPQADNADIVIQREGDSSEGLRSVHSSLRMFATYLYLKPTVTVFLRGKRVLAELISKTCMESDFVIEYQPHTADTKAFIHIGRATDDKERSGTSWYHRNRLIKYDEPIGIQKSDPKGAGKGIVAVVWADYLEPAHNKLDFNMTKLYQRTVRQVQVKLRDVHEKIHEIADGVRLYTLWVQCTVCDKWRTFDDPTEHEAVKKIDTWKCSDHRTNADLQERGCDVPEERVIDTQPRSLSASTVHSPPRRSRGQQQYAAAAAAAAPSVPRESPIPDVPRMRPPTRSPVTASDPIHTPTPSQGHLTHSNAAERAPQRKRRAPAAAAAAAAQPRKAPRSVNRRTATQDVEEEEEEEEDKVEEEAAADLTAQLLALRRAARKFLVTVVAEDWSTLPDEHSPALDAVFIRTVDKLAEKKKGRKKV